MPRLEGRRSTRVAYPAASLEVVSSHDYFFTGKFLQGRACCVAEHDPTKPVVFWPKDPRVTFAMAEAGELEGLAATVALAGDPEGRWRGTACPTCADIILGLGRG